MNLTLSSLVKPSCLIPQLPKCLHTLSIAPSPWAPWQFPSERNANLHVLSNYISENPVLMLHWCLHYSWTPGCMLPIACWHPPPFLCSLWIESLWHMYRNEKMEMKLMNHSQNGSRCRRASSNTHLAMKSWTSWLKSLRLNGGDIMSCLCYEWTCAGSPSWFPTLICQCVPNRHAW